MSNRGKGEVRGVLFDLDGVFYIGDQLVPGAVAALDTLVARGISWRYITNTTTQSAAELRAKLAAMGIPCGGEQLVTAPLATASYLREEGVSRCFFAVSPRVMEDFSGFRHTDDRPEAVVIGDIGEAWSYRLLDRLFQCLLGGARLVAMHRNKYWQREGGLHVDIGAFVAGLEYVAEVEAVITGKPAPAFFAAALASLGVAREAAVLIGDDVYSDVGGAQGVGLRAALVKTGKYREELVAKSGIVPDWILPSVADLVSVLDSPGAVG